MDRLILSIYKKHPGLTRKARTGSKLSAIRLFCLECLGGSSQDVKGCTDTVCPLWSYRLGKGFQPSELPLPEIKHVSNERKAYLASVLSRSRKGNA